MLNKKQVTLNEDGSLVVAVDPELSKVKKYGVIYVYKDTEDLIYKLHSFCTKSYDNKYSRWKYPTHWFWIMMNNSCGIAGRSVINPENNPTTMEEAISERIKAGFVVYETTMNKFCHI